MSDEREKDEVIKASDDDKKDTKKDHSKDHEYEDICYVCRRPESKAGQDDSSSYEQQYMYLFGLYAKKF